ncbi:DNA (cytosine-5-)-methyltransferase [Nemorincola caseinilytica]|uniref:Cytosine-specific methyltransferase n=1 Tax=Nemorincola caseinilytica TaxID=2054315 RepID=A0ABP8NQU8_9BACT
MPGKKGEIRTIELFAGVGGFRIGLERSSGRFHTVWSNQWEPSTKKQDASFVYTSRFGTAGHCNEDIAKVPTAEIPDHDLLVGGFPCQDYSVARTLNKAAGLEGKKGVLWWEIHRILKEKEHKPKYLFLENVDRLLKSPATQRGRDFAIMLASLADLGYVVEWRVINAADHGMPQRRRRVFFLGYHKSTPIYKKVTALKDPFEWVLEKGVMAEAFRVSVPESAPDTFVLEGDLADLSANFNKGTGKKSPFRNSGIMIDRKVYTHDVDAMYDGPATLLRDILLPAGSVPRSFYIDPDSIEQWQYLKGGKSERRINKASGIAYNYAEGAMVFPDPLDRPSRTIITGEGGAAPSRFKHVIKQPGNNKYRRLTPIELERLNMFPDDHTAGVSDIKRAFFMGNALVVGVIERVGKVLAERI